MIAQLDVLVDGQRIGHLYDRHPLTFAYADDCLNGLLRSPIASLLPLRSGDIATPAVLAYFENLLPEGDQRRALEEKHHVTSIFGLLAAAGWDTAGAVVLQPAGSVPKVPAYVKHSWSEVADIIAGQGAPTESAKASISGAQYKLLLSIDTSDGSPLLPVGGSPSTHILKPDIQRAGQKIGASAVNETIMMRAALLCDLPTAHVDYVGAVKSCLVERYDRVVVNGQVNRLNQFDLCQRLKIPSCVKYESDGGSGFAQCYRHVKSASVQPVKDCENLLNWLLFNLYIGNNDGHAKNLSLLETSDGIRLAPFYDLMCTSVYAGFSSNFAFNIGGTFKPGEMGSNELQTLAESVNVSSKYIVKLAQSMAEKILPALQTAIAELKPAFSHSEKIMANRLQTEVASLCKKRSAKLLS
jgi:serine/threonine-protein kinase HipA